MRYGGRKTAATDGGKTRLNSPSISRGARNGFIHSGGPAGCDEVVGSAMGAFSTPRWAGRRASEWPLRPPPHRQHRAAIVWLATPALPGGRPVRSLAAWRE